MITEYCYFCHENATVSFSDFFFFKIGTKMPDDVFTKGDSLFLEFTTSSKGPEKFTAVVTSINPGKYK